MPSAVDGLAEVRDRLRRRGFRVTEVDGWRTRGKGTLRPSGHIWHHTAAPGTGRTRSLRLVTYGRPGLENALCNWYCAVDGELFLVAAGVAWHAGEGIHGSNSIRLGTEWESDGTSQRATPEAYAAMLAMGQECGAVFGYPASANWEHKEHAPRRKIDRYGFSGPAWREAVAIGRPPPPANEGDDDVILVKSKQKGTTLLVGGDKPASIHTGADVDAFLKAGVKLVEVDDVMVDRLVNGRVF